jgi:hypothetical protein
MPIPRRGFLAGLGALMAVRPSLALETQAPQGWDMSWLDRLTGKHKQVFDVGDFEIGLRVVMNWLDAWQNVYGLKHPDVNAIVGTASQAYPLTATDEMYTRFPIGEMWKVTDPATGKPAMRNLFADGGNARVKPLQARGTIFWMCNNALFNIAGRMADAVKRPQPDVFAELKAGLLPNVIVVPAHTMLLGICQERGCTYERV